MSEFSFYHNFFKWHLLQRQQYASAREKRLKTRIFVCFQFYRVMDIESNMIFMHVDDATGKSTHTPDIDDIWPFCTRPFLGKENLPKNKKYLLFQQCFRLFIEISQPNLEVFKCWHLECLPYPTCRHFSMCLLQTPFWYYCGKIEKLFYPISLLAFMKIGVCGVPHNIYQNTDKQKHIKNDN